MIDLDLFLSEIADAKPWADEPGVSGLVMSALETAEVVVAELRAAREAHSRIIRALDKFERDLAFTAPELTGMRIGLLREAIEDAFQPEDDEEAR
jgi:hypothetical protein